MTDALMGHVSWSPDFVLAEEGFCDAGSKVHTEVAEVLAQPEFKPFHKITRLSDEVEMALTEKIDGSNAQIYVPEDPSQPVLSGKRTCWILPGKQDICGFAAWVKVHAEVLRRLGPGRHFGEWWGAGINRNYGFATRRFSLFNYRRFPGGLPDGMPAELRLVPVLYRGAVCARAMQRTISELFTTGSVAEPGWMKPEGVVVTIGAQTWKLTDRENRPKWMLAAQESAE